MKLAHELHFDFTRNHRVKDSWYKNRTKQILCTLGFIFMGSIAVFSYDFHELVSTKTEKLNADYAKQVGSQLDFIYNGDGKFIAGYTKLLDSLKANDEDSILMNYTFLKNRKDISAMGYMSEFDFQVFSNHSYHTQNRHYNRETKVETVTKKEYNLSDNLVNKMKNVYLSQTYPDNLSYKIDCDSNVQYCEMQNRADGIIGNPYEHSYFENHEKLKKMLGK